MDSAKKFFDKHADRYDLQVERFDSHFINFITEFKGGNLLDIGGGSGNFASLLKERASSVTVTVIDPSNVLLSRIKDPRIAKIEGSLPNGLNLRSDQEFDFVHVKEVFHHLVARTIPASKELVQDSLISLKGHLVGGGYLLIHEYYYESFLVPSLSRSLIFYLLKLQNSLNIKIPTKDFVKGLEVCFYTRAELEELLKKNGFSIIRIDEFPFGNTVYKRLLFLRKWGRLLIIAKNSR